MMTIADRIRNRRIELGLSVDDLAERLQKNRATVYRYESNYIKSYSPDVLSALAEVLQTTPAYFYGYDDFSELTPEEEHLLAVYRGANDQAKIDAVCLLENHQRKKEDSHTA